MLFEIFDLVFEQYLRYFSTNLVAFFDRRHHKIIATLYPNGTTKLGGHRNKILLSIGSDHLVKIVPAATENLEKLR